MLTSFKLRKICYEVVRFQKIRLKVRVPAFQSQDAYWRPCLQQAGDDAEAGAALAGGRAQGRGCPETEQCPPWHV